MHSARSRPKPTAYRRLSLTALATLAIAVPSCWSLSDPLPAPPCPAGHKLCDGVCVTYDDPEYGCGAESCERCGDANGTATCDQGVCAISCEDGYGDCTADSGCETPLVNNALHCGMCDYDCRGTECSDGMCGPIQIASEQLRVWNVAADGDYVYWTNNWVDSGEIKSGIWFTRTDATGPEQAQIYAIGTAPEPGDLAIDGGHVYWTAGGWNFVERHEVRRAPLGLTPPLDPDDSDLLSDDTSGPRNASGIAVDAQRVYWTDRGRDPEDHPDDHHYVWSTDKEGTGPPRLLADVPNRRPAILAVDGQHIYWTSDDSGDLYRAPKDPPAEQPPVTDALHCNLPSEIDVGWGIALDDENAYWRVVTDLRSASKDDGCPSIHSLGGDRDCDTPRFMVRDGRCLFWACNQHDNPHADSEILITRTDGTEIAPWSETPSEFIAATVPGGQHGMAVDDQWIYWTDYYNNGDEQNPDGGVYKVARPPLDCD